MSWSLITGGTGLTGVDLARRFWADGEQHGAWGVRPGKEATWPNNRKAVPV